MDDRGFGVRVPVGSRILHIFQTGFGVHPAPYPVETEGVLSLGAKRLGREAKHSPPTRAEVKKMWIYTSTLPNRLHGIVLSYLLTHQDNFTFFLLKGSMPARVKTHEVIQRAEHDRNK
jgi:hypothetical protein